MERMLYGYRYDFVRQGGTRLQLCGVVPLRYEELMRIEWKMMENNDISGLLRLELEQIDMEVKLRYDITGHKMLSQQLAAERFTLSAYYRFLLRCADIMDESKSYMLREEAFWLHENFIFTPVDSKEEPKLIYVPTLRNEPKPPVREQFKQLALRMSACIERIEGDGFSGLLALLHRERFEFHELKKLLNGLLHAEPQFAERAFKPPAELRSGESMAPSAGSFTAAQPASMSMPSSRLQEPAKSRPLIPEWIVPSIAEHDESELGELPDVGQLTAPSRGSEPVMPPPRREAAAHEPLNSRQQLGVAAAACALLLLVWSFYPDDAPEGALSVWIGLTILIVDFVFVWIRLNPRLLRLTQWQRMAQSVRAMEERDTGGLTGYLPSAFKKKDRETVAKVNASPLSSAKSGNLVDVPTNPDVDRPAVHGLGHIHQPNDGATVWLPPRKDLMAAAAVAGERLAWLERQNGGESERLELTGERYIIGRERQAVQYALHEPGVSKLHLEITYEQKCYYVKDLGSKNGALWNEEPMVPYKLYPLADGDRLTVIQTVFVFKHPNSQTTVHP
ncbi:MAG: hypothetical protein K0Q59_1020 [Paenibacillus sp.]|nr:hypothetical protein [Paenibacillus sp.]